jgi:hypothetical protein
MFRGMHAMPTTGILAKGDMSVMTTAGVVAKRFQTKRLRIGTGNGVRGHSNELPPQTCACLAFWASPGRNLNLDRSPAMGTHLVKGNYTTTARGTFPYCKEHNRLFPHPVVGWLTPVHPEQLDTFQALCDFCTGATSCSTVAVLKTTPAQPATNR